MSRVSETASALERVRQIADDYRAKGYEVTLEPKPDQLPSALSSFQPDMVAQKDDDAVVIEVRSRPAIRPQPSLESLARAIREIPGWRLELVIEEPDIAFPLPGRTLPWTTRQASDALDEADQLFGAGHTEAALLMAWAGTEASLRLVAEREGVKTERNEANTLLNRLTSEGVLGRRDYQSLRGALALRNAVAHGLKPDTTVRSKVRSLLRIARGLLAPSFAD